MTSPSDVCEIWIDEEGLDRPGHGSGLWIVPAAAGAAGVELVTDDGRAWSGATLG